MSSFSIYDLSDSYLAVQDMMLQGGDTEELSKHLDAIDDAFEDKAESYAIVMKNLDASIDALKQEEKRLKDKRQALENHKSSLKQRLESEMIRTGKTKFKTGRFSFGIQKNPPSIEIWDEYAIGQEYIKTIYEIDRTKIKNALKAGEEVNGARLHQSESLRIR